MDKNISCNGCKDRKVGCHSNCEKYNQFVKEYHQEQEWEKQQKQLNYHDYDRIHKYRAYKQKHGRFFKK